MKKPKAVIIGESEKARRNLKEILKKQVKNETGIDFRIVTAKGCRLNSEGVVYFIYETPEDKTKAPKIAETLIEKGVKAGKVLTTRGKEPYKETMTEEGYKFFSGWLPKNSEEEFDEGEVIRKVQELRRDRKLFHPISLGIIGLGKLGRQVVKDAKSRDWLKEVHAYTGFVKGDYSLIRAQIGIERDEDEKVHFHRDLEEVVEANPDILLITTGEFGIPYKKYSTRRDLRKRLLDGAMPKVEPVLNHVLKTNFSGIISMEANPNGDLLYIAKHKGIPVDQLTSFTPDTVRHKTLLLEKLKREHPDLKYNEIHLTVIGEHGEEIPLLSECTVRDMPLKEFDKRFDNPEFRERFTEEGRAIGLKVMQAAERLKDNYGGTPGRILEVLDGIAHLQGELKSSIYTYLTKEDGFLSVPSRLIYPLRVRLYNGTIDELTKDEGVREEVKRQLKAQKEFSKPYLEK
ncbi:hypothetical protein DRN73_03780 [Candidatus Pacearchaeota archaeon]|nr:MAG: hypothetical protein DRN73_03780 [Candidatus Pacearchaeota archaeon]